MLLICYMYFSCLFDVEYSLILKCSHGKHYVLFVFQAKLNLPNSNVLCSSHQNLYCTKVRRIRYFHQKSSFGKFLRRFFFFIVGVISMSDTFLVQYSRLQLIL